jgi:hypothetical protein
MFTKILKSAALVLAAALAGAPAISQAATSQQTAPIQATYNTAIQSVYGSSVPWTGTMQLTINPDGIIQGYYHPADNPTAFIQVNGGRNGDHVWLDIGRTGHLHVIGDFQNGVITGGAIDQTTQQEYKFSAKVAD